MQIRLLVLGLCAACVFHAGAGGTNPDRAESSPRFSFGFSERFRLVTWDNVITLDDLANAANALTQHRTSAWGTFLPHPDWEFTAKLTNEFRYYFIPDRDFTINEVIFDWLYLKWHNRRYLPATVTAGRQNMIFGEGFLIMDANPSDGSRIISFNAARADIECARSHTLTLFYVFQPRIDDVLPIINDQKTVLIEQPEEGYGAYYMGEFSRVKLHAYYIRKNILPVADRYPHLSGSQITILGARVSRPFRERLSWTGEAAYQFGIDKRDNASHTPGRSDRSAGGGYMHLDYTTGWPAYAPARVTAGCIYLSGDNPRTRTMEDWNPVFARWPKWSESYIYTLIGENGVAYWSNLVSIHGQVEFTFSSQLSFRFDYHHLKALYRESGSFPGGGGLHRGDLIIGKLNFQINTRLTGHLLWEGFRPGSYYFPDADGYSWVRAEFMFTL